MNSTEKDSDDDIVTKIIQKEIRKRRKDKKKTDAEIITNNYESKSSKDDYCTLIFNTSKKKIKKKQREACEIKKNVDPREDVHGFISSTIIKNESYQHKKKKKLKGDVVTSLSTTSNILEEDEEHTFLLTKVAKNMKKAKKMATQITELPNETKPKHSTCNHKYNSENNISAVYTEKIHSKKNVDCDLIEHKKTNEPKKDSNVTTYTEDKHGDEEYTPLSPTVFKKLKKKKKEATTVSTHVKNMPQNNTRKQKWRIKSKELETEYLGNDFTAVQQIETSSTKIYECNVCGKNFELLSSLNKHKAKSHVAHEVLDDAFSTKISTNSERDEECSKLLKPVLKKMKKQHKIKNKVVNRVKTMPLKKVEMQWKQPLANHKEYLENQKKRSYACRFCREMLKYFSN